MSNDCQRYGMAKPLLHLKEVGGCSCLRGGWWWRGCIRRFLMRELIIFFLQGRHVLVRSPSSKRGTCGHGRFSIRNSTWEPQTSHVIFRISMPVADFPVGPWPWLCPPLAGPRGGGPCKLAVEGPALRPAEALCGRLRRFLFAEEEGSWSHSSGPSAPSGPSASRYLLRSPAVGLHKELF